MKDLADLSDYEVMIGVQALAEKAKIPAARRGEDGPGYDLVRLVLEERDRLRGRDAGVLPVLA